MMKLKVVVVSMLFSTALYAQPPTRISWAGELNGKHCPLDSVIVTNKSSGEKLVFYYPDTVLMYGDNVGIKPIKQETETGLKIYPNPFADHTQVDFSLAYPGEVDMTVYDFLGREIIRQSRVLEKGTHRFKISLPQGIYNLNLQTAEGTQSARLISEGKESVVPLIIPLATSPPVVDISRKAHKSNDTEFPFNYGDTLMIQGFISESDVFQYKHVHIVPLTEDAHITFAFFNIVDTIWIELLKGPYSCLYDSDSVPFIMPGGDDDDSWWWDGEQFVGSVILNDFLFVNTQSQLDSVFACANSIPDIDFEQQTLLLAKGHTIVNGGISLPSIIQIYDGHFILQAKMSLTGSYVIDPIFWAILIHKPLSKEQISIQIIYKD